MIKNIIGHKYFWIGIVVLGLLLGIILFLNKKSRTEQYNLLLNEIDDTSKQDGGTASLSNSNALSPNYYKQFSTGLMTRQSAINIAKVIIAADGILDDEEKVIGQMKLIKNKAQLSQVSEQITLLTGKDMYTFLKNFMENNYWGGKNYMLDVLKIVNALPNN